MSVNPWDQYGKPDDEPKTCQPPATHIWRYGCFGLCACGADCFPAPVRDTLALHSGETR